MELNQRRVRMPAKVCCICRRTVSRFSILTRYQNIEYGICSDCSTYDIDTMHMRLLSVGLENKLEQWESPIWSHQFKLAIAGRYQRSEDDLYCMYKNLDIIYLAGLN